MHDLGYEYDYSCSPCCGGSDEKKKRKEYPCLYIRGKAIPEMKVDADGFGTATIKFRILGFRSPAEGEKSLELEVQEISGSGPKEGKGPEDAGDMLEAELSRGSADDDDEE